MTGFYTEAKHGPTSGPSFTGLEKNRQSVFPKERWFGLTESALRSPRALTMVCFEIPLVRLLMFGSQCVTDSLCSDLVFGCSPLLNQVIALTFQFCWFASFVSPLNWFDFMQFTLVSLIWIEIKTKQNTDFFFMLLTIEAEATWESGRKRCLSECYYRRRHLWRCTLSIRVTEYSPLLLAHTHTQCLLTRPDDDGKRLVSSCGNVPLTLTLSLTKCSETF